jgi:DNA-binding CsgD family transcriptional regulator
MIREFDFDSPGLLPVLESANAMEVFQHLRMKGEPLTVATLSQLSAKTDAAIQEQLDLLCAAGLVESIRASRLHRQTRYRPCADRVRVRANLADPQVTARVASLTQQEQDRVRRYINSCESADPNARPQWRYFGIFLPVMSSDDLAELYSRVGMVTSFLATLEKREQEKGQTASAAGISAPRRQHAVSLDVHPLNRFIPTSPTIEFIGTDSHSSDSTAGLQATESLAPREKQIAQLLAEGLSRPRIAKSLGLSPHTVCTVSTRIYRKLGVRSRAELAKVILGRWRDEPEADHDISPT